MVMKSMIKYEYKKNKNCCIQKKIQFILKKRKISHIYIEAVNDIILKKEKSYDLLLQRRNQMG